jgi:hypothetical protein
VEHEPRRPAVPDAYSEPERRALELADELRDRVQREREVVRRLQEHLERAQGG